MVFYHQGGTIRIVYGDHVVEDPMSIWPKLIARTVIPVSQWLSVISRDVQFSPQDDVETYYAIEQPDYLVGVPVTPGERILLVRQYRPALEKFSLELPAGMGGTRTPQQPWLANSWRRRVMRRSRSN